MAKRVFVETFKDEKIREYLDTEDLLVYIVGFDGGKVYVNKYPRRRGIKLEKLIEYQVTLEHVDLLNCSLKNRSVTFA